MFNRIAVVKGDACYPKLPPFDPPERYPELSRWASEIDASNGAYPMVREAFRLMGLDAERFGTAEWNPLGEIITPGQSVLLKPNFVLDRNLGEGPLEAVITHPAVLRAIADYVLIALQGSGKLTVGDAPQMDCRWQHLLEQTGMDVLGEWLSARAGGVQFELVDFRNEEATLVRTVVWERKQLRDPRHAGIEVTLGSESAMDGVHPEHLYGADYDRRKTRAAHEQHRHSYVVAPEVLAADVVISVPKLKTHSKVGTTLNLKNMVGINVDKNHLPHFRVGSPAEGGDEFRDGAWDSRIDRWFSDVLMSRGLPAGKYGYLGWRAFRSALRMAGLVKNVKCAGGNWHGNDTAWRMALDLNRVLVFADQEGKMRSEPQRKYFSVMDGVVAGEGDGPLQPDAFAAQMILCGFDPVMLDWVATQAMGFDPTRIPLYRNARADRERRSPGWSLDRVAVYSNHLPWERALTEGASIFNFVPPGGWRGSIEAARKNSESRTCARQ